MLGTAETLTLNHTLEMAEGSTLRVDILSPTEYDRIVVSGDAVLSNAMELELFIPDTSALSNGNRFDILQVGSGSAVPSLDELADLFQVSFANGTLSLMLAGNSVPESSAWILMLLGTGTLFAVRRKNRNVTERL